MNKVFISTICLSFTFLSCSTKDQDITPYPSGSTGKYDFSQVDKYLYENLSAYNGHVAVLVMQDGEIIYKQQMGLRTDRKLSIASASKWLSGAVIMSLVDDGMLSLDDTVGRFLPIFSQYQKGNITIRQLFSHTAGFEGDIGADDLSRRYEYRKDLSINQVVDSIAVYDNLVNQPGTAFNYGETSMQIAGRIAEVVSGKPWQELFDEKIGRPCGMQAQYSKMTAENPMIGGGVSTTAEDYIRFLEMMVNKGTYDSVRVLSENAIHIMEQDQVQDAEIQTTPYPSNQFTSPEVSPVKYGIGNWLDVLDEHGNVVETSSPGVFGTHPWQDSKHHIAGIIFTFTTPRKSNAISLEIRKMIRDIVDNSTTPGYGE